MSNEDNIFIMVHSLKYEPAPSQPQIITRAQWYRLRTEKARKEQRRSDQFIQRYSPKKWQHEARQIEREESRKAYDKAIMKKYNVGPDYRQSRYFMEEIRPTLN